MSINNLTKPYTYLIGWSSLNIWYYGVRFAKGCNPTDLWITYFTSSKYVKDFVAENGDPDVIQIRKTFSTAEQAQEWEEKVLTRMKVISRNDFLNKTNTNRIKTVAITNGLKKFWASLSLDERRDHLKNAHAKSRANPKVWTEEARESNRKSSKKFWATLSLEEKRKLNEPSRAGTIAYQKSSSPEEKSARGKKAGSSPRKIKTCPHCGFTGKGNMTRWHFDKCKHAPKMI